MSSNRIGNAVRPDPNNRALLQRLRSAEGHLKAVTAMVESGQPCQNVLPQLAAVQAALNAVACLMLRDQIKCSMAVILEGNFPEERQAEIEELISLYQLFTKYPQYFNEVIHEPTYT